MNFKFKDGSSKIIGFRSNSKWKKVVASIYYLFVIILAISTVTLIFDGSIKNITDRVIAIVDNIIYIAILVLPLIIILFKNKISINRSIVYLGCGVLVIILINISTFITKFYSEGYKEYIATSNNKEYIEAEQLKSENFIEEDKEENNQSEIIQCEVNNKNEEVEEEEVSDIAKEDIDTQVMKYDSLQQLYLDINDDMSYNEILSLVESSGLPYSTRDYSQRKGIKVAFKKEVTPFTHAESGDNLEIMVDDTGNLDDRNVIQNVEYFNNKKFVTAVFYVKGVYWDFRDCCEKYKGYYINDYKNSNGIEITYDNGNTKKSSYQQMESKEEQLQYIEKFKK